MTDPDPSIQPPQPDGANSPAVMQVAHLDGGPLQFYVHGEGRPVLYLHAAGGARWTRPLEQLAARYKLWVPVMPGFDGSAAHPGFESMAGSGALAGQFIDQVIGERCDVIGQSFGASVACWLAVLRPERIGQLVLASPAGIGSAGASPTNLDDEALLARLGEIDALTLIVHGNADRSVPASSVQRLRARIRRSYLIYVHDATHDVEVDQPERFHRLVEGFLARAEAFVVNWDGAAR